jgi:hypothetical protein
MRRIGLGPTISSLIIGDTLLRNRLNSEGVLQIDIPLVSLLQKKIEAPRQTSFEHEPNGSQPVPGGGARERERRLRRMKKEGS